MYVCICIYREGEGRERQRERESEIEIKKEEGGKKKKTKKVCKSLVLVPLCLLVTHKLTPSLAPLDMKRQAQLPFEVRCKKDRQ